LSEELVALSLFDPEVTTSQKRKIVECIQINRVQDEPLKRCNFNLESLEAIELHDFTTSNTLQFFNILGLNYDFLDTEPEIWESLKSYCNALDIVKNLRVTNDNAER